MKNYYSKKLKEIREQLKLSQRMLGERIGGLSRDKINSYEHNRVRIPAEVWEKILKLSGESWGTDH